MTKAAMRYFTIAKKASCSSGFDDYKIGAVVVYKGKVISIGRNMVKTHPLQSKYDGYRLDPKYIPVSTHAETNALSKIIERDDIVWSKCSIYIYREVRNGQVAMARPCNSCMQLMKDLGIINVYYTTDMGYAHEVITPETQGKVCCQRNKKATP